MSVPVGPRTQQHHHDLGAIESVAAVTRSGLRAFEHVSQNPRSLSPAIAHDSVDGSNVQRAPERTPMRDEQMLSPYTGFQSPQWGHPACRHCASSCLLRPSESNSTGAEDSPTDIRGWIGDTSFRVAQHRHARCLQRPT